MAERPRPKSKPRGAASVLLAAWLAFAGPFGGVAASFNQQDGFQDGSTMAWGGNRLGMVTHAPRGGPDGADDAFLQVSVAGFHLGTKNTSQWAGDYLAAGIEAIEMDLNHLDPGVDRLNMRLLLFGPGGTYASRAITADVPANRWTHHVFGLTSNDLVRIEGGPGALNDTLAGVTTLLIRNDRAIPTPPGTHPPHIMATLGIDNIHAISRQPVIRGHALNGNLATLDLIQLVEGSSHRVETTDDLIMGEWSTVLQFDATSETTNATVPLDSEAGYLRTVSP